MKAARVLLSLAAMAVGLAYVLNPGMGVFELVPDNLPLFGNLDEAAATALFLAGWKGLRGPGRPVAGAR